MAAIVDATQIGSVLFVSRSLPKEANASKDGDVSQKTTTVFVEKIANANEPLILLPNKFRSNFFYTLTSMATMFIKYNIKNLEKIVNFLLVGPFK